MGSRTTHALHAPILRDTRRAVQSHIDLHTATQSRTQPPQAPKASERGKGTHTCRGLRRVTVNQNPPHRATLCPLGHTGPHRATQPCTATHSHTELGTATQPHSHTATQPHSHTATQPHPHTATQPHSHTLTHAATATEGRCRRMDGFEVGRLLCQAQRRLLWFSGCSLPIQLRRSADGECCDAGEVNNPGTSRKHDHRSCNSRFCTQVEQVVDRGHAAPTKRHSCFAFLYRGLMENAVSCRSCQDTWCKRGGREGGR